MEVIDVSNESTGPKPDDLTNQLKQPAGHVDVVSIEPNDVARPHAVDAVHLLRDPIPYEVVAHRTWNSFSLSSRSEILREPDGQVGLTRVNILVKNGDQVCEV